MSKVNNVTKIFLLKILVELTFQKTQ